MQRLEWRQALKNFEQIRTLDPGDAKVRANLIDLNMRMGQDAAAISELDSYISFLESSRQQNRIIPFLEDLVKEHPDTLELHQRLAEYLRQAGKITEAVSEFDRVGDILMDSGNIHGVIAVIQTIISLNPPNVTEYRGVLDKLKGSL
jgi:DNA-binding SARP family transcriptional activator